MRLLNTIDNPSSLRQLSPSALPELTAEIRDRIIEVVSKNGTEVKISRGTTRAIIMVSNATLKCNYFIKTLFNMAMGGQTPVNSHRE